MYFLLYFTFALLNLSNFIPLHLSLLLAYDEIAGFGISLILEAAGLGFAVARERLGSKYFI